MTNQKCVILPVVEAIRRAEWLGEHLGCDGEIFVRPDAADKSLSGGTIELVDLSISLKRYAMNPTSLVLVAPPKRIHREWRLFIANSRLVTGSQYLDAGEIVEVAQVPAEVMSFADRVLQSVSWRPDPLFVMDIAEDEDGLSVLELNPYSCAGTYAGDTARIVDVAIQQAFGCW